MKQSTNRQAAYAEHLGPVVIHNQNIGKPKKSIMETPETVSTLDKKQPSIKRNEEDFLRILAVPDIIHNITDLNAVDRYCSHGQIKSEMS